ncbi:hypothetical protein OU997_03275 [Pseudomonas sp. SL4(2022)]|uniref:hypothetical protein n=1 Tax=Pseudomonas sp. SL4(2022) TaxID=2994661 RepID=UPI00226EC7C0|nr:hypothetical protein [Pseudomonas sp. SL4(2022)]WAC45230.1 hypothetical protein OU997_03275 [Pseudomonas sp. SL4(2022)]
MRALLYLVALVFSSSAVSADIQWAVKNGFPVFRDPEAFNRIKDRWKPDMFTAEFLASLNTQDIRTLLPLTGETLWDPQKRVYDEAKLFNPKHSIVAQAVGYSEGASCTWFHDGKKLGLPISCNLKREIPDIEERKPFALMVRISDGQEVEKEDLEIKTRFIVGLGDSFASGEGNPDHAAIGTNLPVEALKKGANILDTPGKVHGRFRDSAKWWDVTCHRSLLSWQSLRAMQIAVTNPDTVVRFASFSCSGAEAYDGFFRAQLNPPVIDESPSGVYIHSERDGGNFRDPSGKYEEDKLSTPALNKSQMNALIDLLCIGGVRRAAERHNFGIEQRPLQGRLYYGKVKFDSCDGKLRKVDDVLMSIGGNDFGFAGVVKWGLVPRRVYPAGDINSSIPLVALYAKAKTDAKLQWMYVFRKIARVIDPNDANKAAKGHLKIIYKQINYALNKYAGIDPKRVTGLVYPNPIQRPLPGFCSSRLDYGNVMFTAHVEKQAKLIPGFNVRAKYFQFLLDEESAKAIEEIFINNLRAYQVNAMSETKWNQIDSNEVFKGRSLCNVAPNCQAGVGCPANELFTWYKPAKEADQHASTMPIQSFENWQPYASDRSRAVRTGNDSFMTQVRFDKAGGLENDWFNGPIHPDAIAHAGIADLIAAREKSK